MDIKIKMKIFKKENIPAVVCAFFLLSGLMGLSLGPQLVAYLIKSELILAPNSKIIDLWVEPPVPIILDFYFHNWTNPQDLYNHSIKPHFVQMGPYRFTEKYKKVDITWNDNDTVSFGQVKAWQFDAENSNGTLKDNVTTLNSIAVGAAVSSRHFSYVFRKGVSMALAALVPNELYITKTTGELMFDGYEDILIKTARSMPSLKGLEMPPWDKFAFFYGRNNTKSFNGVLNMATGTGKHLVGEIQNWDFESYKKFFPGECGKVSGSAGELFPPFRTKDYLSLFSPDACRKLILEYEKEEEYLGVRGYKYTARDRALDNGTLYPENSCYCNGGCTPSGLLNVSSCRYGAPAFASLPHFYNADPYYINKVDGLRPKKEEHEFYVTVEPRTGIPLDVSIKVQVNIMLQEVPDITYVKGVPKIFFPMVWVDQHASVTQELADRLTFILSLPSIGYTMSAIMLTIGIIILVVLVSMSLIKYYKLKDKKVNLSKEEVPLNENVQKIEITNKVRLNS